MRWSLYVVNAALPLLWTCLQFLRHSVWRAQRAWGQDTLRGRPYVILCSKVLQHCTVAHRVRSWLRCWFAHILLTSVDRISWGCKGHQGICYGRDPFYLGVHSHKPAHNAPVSCWFMETHASSQTATLCRRGLHSSCLTFYSHPVW